MQLPPDSRIVFGADQDLQVLVGLVGQLDLFQRDLAGGSAVQFEAGRQTRRLDLIVLYNGSGVAATITVSLGQAELVPMMVLTVKNGETLRYRRETGWIVLTAAGEIKATIASGGGTTDHGALTGLTDDDHAQYHNDARGDARYYRENEHINTSAGPADAGKPVVLDADGNIDATMINDADIDHGSIGGLTDDDHVQYLLINGTRPMTGDLNMGSNDIDAVHEIELEEVASIVSPGSSLGRVALISATNAVEFKDEGDGQMYMGVRHHLAHVYLSDASQAITHATWTKVELNARVFDLESSFDIDTNYRFVPTVPGYYLITWNVEFGQDSGEGSEISPYISTAPLSMYFKSSIYVSGVRTADGSTDSFNGMKVEDAPAEYPSSHGSALVYLNGAEDYVELFAYGENTSSWDIYARPNSERTYLCATLINKK